MFRFWRRTILIAVVGLAATLGGCLGVVDKALTPPAFYVADDHDLVGPPGTLIRQQPILDAPSGTTAYRLLYRSTGLDGKSIPVSGFIVIPNGPIPAGGSPIVAWAHPTSGVVPHCAPSEALSKFDSVQGLNDMVKRGYVIVATDYPGLGTSEPHPYLVGVSEGRAVLDSVRVARDIPGSNAGPKFIAWGHSQGGQAVLYTGLLARAYAPDLKLVGVAAAAPATDLATLLSDDFNTVGGKNLTAMTIWSWSRVFGADINKVVEPQAMPTVDKLANECIESLFDILAREHTEKPLQKSFLSVSDITKLEPWRSLMMRNTPGALPPGVPLFIAQGTADGTVRPAVTASYVRSLCNAGSAVRVNILSGVSHAFIARDSAAAAVSWMDDRFAGKTAPTDCGKALNFNTR